MPSEVCFLKKNNNKIEMHLVRKDQIINFGKPLPPSIKTENESLADILQAFKDEYLVCIEGKDFTPEEITIASATKISFLIL